MRPRLPLRRILFCRPLVPPNCPRLFTQNTLASRPRPRPQLPFLSPRSSKTRPVARFLTTDTKRWIKDEVRKGVKYTAIAYTGTFLLLVIAFGVQQEYLDRKFPSPHEWSWVLRKNYRSAKWSDRFQDSDEGLVDWARTGHWYVRLLERLEDPRLDGAGLQQQEEGGILVAGVGRTGFDITNKPEPWRRGYYEVLMGAAKAAEHLDGWVRDRRRNISFPANVMIGPSNPNPRPVPPGAATAPREEDCETAYDRPETYYMRILTTRGFTDKQRLDAALEYGSWLDFKGTPEAALETYKWAVDIANTNGSKSVIDRATGVLSVKAGPVSSNVLSATTALGIHHATNSNLAVALPIFLSVLRARKCLPEPPQTMRSTLVVYDDDVDPGFWANLMCMVKYLLRPPDYPPPPDDGMAPPQRDSKERCEEAGIMAYIGEILYASSPCNSSQEEGLAWTREAVDIVEEVLRGRGVNKEGKKICKDCLQVGLDNWAKMVAKLAHKEKRARANALKTGGWLGFGGDEHKEIIGRWESEEQVVKERMRRAKEVLGSSRAGTVKSSSMLFM